MPITTEGQREEEEYNNEIFTESPAVQNTWYTVLTVTRPGHLIDIFFGIDTANETLEVEVTIDGVVLPFQALAAIADTDYQITMTGDISSNRIELGGSGYNPQNAKLMLPFRGGFTIRIRKTTAVGAGDLDCYVVYGLR